MAQTIKLKRSATQGAAPTTSQLELGEIAINTYDGKVYIKKDDGTASIVEVGTSGNPVLGGIDTYTYTATASQTTFSGSDDNAATLSYTVGDIQVFLNGVLLDSSDYTATNGTSIVLASGAAVNDKLVVSSYTTDTVSNLAYYDDTTANFTGTLQNGGSNVVVDSDIGSTVQAYDADTAKYDDTTANFTGTLQNGGSNVVVDSDIGSTVQAYDADTAKYDDTTANFTGTLQNAGSNVVVDSDIGSTVQAYDADTAKYDDTTANFTGTLQNGGSNVVVDSDIGSTVQAYDSNLTSFVSAFTLPTSDGTADQVLTTNGSGTLSFATASGGGGGGGGSFTATASGALSDGTLVVVNSDGTVSSAATLTATESLGSGTSYESGSVDNQRAVFIGSNKIALMYRDTGNSDYHTLVVGTISGTSISFGTPSVIVGGNITGHVGMAYDSANDKVVLAYRDPNNSNYGTAKVGTVSGTSISFGTAVVFTSGAISLPRPVYDSANGKIVIVWGPNAAIVGTVSGTSISFGSSTTLAASGISVAVLNTVYDSTNGKVVVAFSNNLNSYYGEAIVGTVSGTSISFGSKTTFVSNRANACSIVHDSGNNKIVIFYENDDQGDRADAVVGTVSGTSISFGTPVTVVNNITAYNSIVYDSASGEVVVFYGNTTDSDNGYYAIGSVSGTSITFGTPVKFANDAYYITSTYVSDSYVSAFFYYTGATSNMQGRVFRNDYTIQKLTSENYVGISDGAYSSGATATIQTFGSVDDAQTGLTPGQAYYVQTDGTLSTTVSSPAVLAGVAVSSTELLIATSDLAGALTSSDIGSTVQAYDADTAKYDDATANFTGTLQNGGSNVVVDTDIGSTVQAYDSNLTSFVSAFTLPTTDGTADQVLKTNGSGTLSFADASGGTLGTLTKTFTANETATITLTDSVLVPLVSVTKEVGDPGGTNNSWDVNSTTENYTRANSALATTLDFCGFDISTAKSTCSLSLSDRSTNPDGIAFNTDGTKMFIVDYADYDVKEYTLSTAFDLSTASYSQNFSVISQETSPCGIAFNTNGTKMFIVGYAGDDVNEYTLSTGFDISTATYSQNFSVASQDTSPRGVAFSSNGTKMFIAGFTNSAIYEYTLSTGFDVSTASYSQNFSVSGQETQVRDVTFNTDGTKMFVVGSIGDSVFEYDLSTGFDVSTASYSTSVSAVNAAPSGIAFNSDGTKMFVCDDNSNEVYRYNLSTGFDVSTATHNFSVSSQTTNPYEITFNNDGTKMFILGSAAVSEYTLSTGFDTTTASYSQNFDVSGQETNPTSMAFNTDGTKMFIVGTTGDDVNEYDLSTGFDVSTASYSQNFSVASQDTTPYAIAFNNDGTKMFIIGGVGDDVNEYTLSTGFDVSTATYSRNFSVANEDTSPQAIVFNNDGTKMFIVGDSGDDVNEYTLSTGFDISTATYSQNFSVSTQESQPSGIAFNTNGTKMFIVGLSGDDVNEYNLDHTFVSLGTGSFASADVGKTIYANSGEFILTSTGGDFVETTAPTSYAQVASGSWEMYAVVYNTTDGDLELSATVLDAFDISTAIYANNFSISAEETDPQGIAFNNDGTKMFIIGTGGDAVYEYTLSTAFNVSTATYSQNFSVASQETTPTGIAFNANGTKMFILGNTGDAVYEYTLSTGFDVSTASYSQNFSVASQTTTPYGIAFNNDGTLMYIIGGSSSVYRYSLSTGFDISTASLSGSGGISSSVETQAKDLVFNPDGSKAYVIGTSSDAVNEYTLSVGFDFISSGTYSQTFSVSSQESTPYGIAFNTDGTKMFIVGSTGDDVNEYNIGTIATPSGYSAAYTTTSTDSTNWTDINYMTADESANNGNIYYAVSTDDRTTWSVAHNTDGIRNVVRNNAGTWEYNSNGTYDSETWTAASTNTELSALEEAMEAAEYVLGSGFDLSTASYSQNFSVSSQDTSPQGIAFNTDGTKMFIVGDSGNDVNEYTLSTGFDVSTASYSQNFSVASQEATPTGIAFNSDGTKMFIVGSGGDDVNEYTLSTGFDVSTASYSQNFSVASQDILPMGIAFNTDGTKMFIIGFSGDYVSEYTLSTGFDVSTATYSQNFSVQSQEVQPRDVAFNGNGTKMFIVGTSNSTVYEYTLGTGFDVSTASYSKGASVEPQETDPQGIAFNTDGTKMFIVGNNGDEVNEYTIGTWTSRNKMNKTQLEAVTDANHFTLGDDLDLAIIFNLSKGSIPPSSDGVSVNYEGLLINEGAILGTDYTFNTPAQNSVKITAVQAGNYKVRVL